MAVRNPEAIVGLFRPNLQRNFVNPRVQEAENAFQRMMQNFKSKSREERIRDGMARARASWSIPSPPRW